ncbi:MAG: heme exporter protein CcmB [Acidobacteriaceae bacterium]|nr:heme exporter protein CcmB [Acidobacteriaceae bacterium]
MSRVLNDLRQDLSRARSYFGHVFLHLQKDLRLEWRSRDSVVGMLFFALLVVIIFSLAFDPTAAISRQIAGGILWVALLFASFTALNQSWTREQRNRVLEAHRMSPASPSALFLGKALANLIFVSFVELILAPLFLIFYNLHALGEGWKMLIVMPLGTWALVCNGTFFAAMGLRTRNRELLLPLILVPISLPALMGMMQATTAILTGEFDPGLWIRLLIAYNIAFTTVCLLLFDAVLCAE